MRTGNVSPAPATRTMGGPASHVHTEPFSIAQAACSEVTRARKPPALHICARTGRDSQIASRPVSDESRLTASGPVSFTSASVRSRRGWHHPPSNVPQSLLANEALAPPTSPRCPTCVIRTRHAQPRARATLVAARAGGAPARTAPQRRSTSARRVILCGVSHVRPPPSGSTPQAPGTVRIAPPPCRGTPHASHARGHPWTPAPPPPPPSKHRRPDMSRVVPCPRAQL